MDYSKQYSANNQYKISSNHLHKQPKPVYHIARYVNTQILQGARIINKLKGPDEWQTGSKILYVRCWAESFTHSICHNLSTFLRRVCSFIPVLLMNCIEMNGRSFPWVRKDNEAWSWSFKSNLWFGLPHFYSFSHWIPATNPWVGGGDAFYS